MKALLMALFLLCSSSSLADDIERHEIKIVKHKFVPSILNVSAGKVIKLKIINTDTTVEEFESFDLKREKIVPGNNGKKDGEINVTVGPLKPGTYSYFGEFHVETAQGKIIAK